MKKNTSKKTKTLIEKTKEFFDKKPIIAFSALTMLLMVGVFLLDQGASMFKASILEGSPFDGTTMPIKKVPNWAKTGGANTKKYSEYSKSELVNLPEYNLKILQSSNTDTNTINSKITYSVVYMGNYKLDHKEKVGSHLAVDIKLPIGTPVYSVANGVVSKAVTGNSGFGTHLCIKHTNVPVNGKKETLYSCYNHLNDLKVKVGQAVKKGDLVAHSGETGTSTTPHLHFQIDTESAPWHPWWPFTSAEASAAGLNFFEAINAGLGQDDALKNTINPMEWVQEYKNYKSSGNSSSEKEPNKKPAEDTTTKDPEAKPDDKPVDTPKTPDTSETHDEPEISKTPDSFQIDVESFIRINEDAEVKITALDENNKVMKDFELENSLKVRINGDAEIYPSTLSEKNFKNGIATLKVRSDVQNTFTIQVGANQIEVNSIKEALSVEQFDINIDGELAIDTPSKIIINTLDKNGDKTANSFKGTAILSLVQGEGEFSPKALSSKNFQDGKAEAIFTPSSSKNVKIRVKTGTIVGNTRAVAVSDEVKEVAIFSDVPTSHDHFKAITELKKEGIIDGFSDGTFKPSLSINRVETVKMLLLGLEIPVTTGEVAFNDVVSGEWFEDYLYTGVEKEIVNGFPDNTFKPAQQINRAEFFKILLNSADVKLPNVKKAPFKDVEQDAWFARYAQYAKDNALLDFNNNKFEPARFMTRAEVAEALYRLNQ
ncbi:MAG: S-layer homology domain-containing protein [Candidatus Gracilibacteria bacterium]|jgi:hypothetical protein|nr:S-layer homology domain-containing protein [Candidatus Gracilibacteria bacterium]